MNFPFFWRRGDFEDKFFAVFSLPDPYFTISNDETFASELLKNLKEIFPMYHIQSDKFSLIIHILTIRVKRIAKRFWHTKLWLQDLLPKNALLLPSALLIQTNKQKWRVFFQKQPTKWKVFYVKLTNVT